MNDEEAQEKVDDLAEHILWQAINGRASDVHFAPDSKNVFFKVDGELHKVVEPPSHVFSRLVDHFFRLAGLVQDELSPQYGRIHLEDKCGR